MVAYKYDKDGHWIPGEEIQIGNDENLPENYTTKELPQPCWKPVFINGEWEETATEEEKQPSAVEVILTPDQQEIAFLKAENENLKKLADDLRARDAKMNDDLLFVMEIMEANGMLY
jgi:hypothetical protein